MKPLNSMMKNKTRILAGSVLSAGILLAGYAIAEPGKGRFPIDLNELQARSAQHFAAADRDDSGFIELAEFENMERHGGKRAFQKHGKKHGKKHAMQRRGGDSESRQAMRAAAGDKLFAILDKDGNDNLSQAEFAAKSRQDMQLARKQAAFAMLDKDQDQRLSAAEMPSPLSRLQAADADGDGQVTREEMRAHRASRG